jgi:hypothetical protein
MSEGTRLTAHRRKIFFSEEKKQKTYIRCRGFAGYLLD